jgi:hypothetical protein
LEAVKLASPNSLSSLFATLDVPLKLITNALAAPLLDLACPAMGDLTLGGKPLWEDLQDLFPGAAKSGGGL